MNLLGRIMALVVLGLLLQFAAGPGARASVPQREYNVATCSVQSASTSPSVELRQTGISYTATSANECDNGACSGLTCSCPCHGMASAIIGLSFAFPDVLASIVAQAPPRGFTQFGVNPPVRPPKI